MTEFEEYFTAIYDHKIIACKKMQKQSERLLNAFVQPEKYHFDYDIASKHIKFIETFCCYPSGEKMGQPFEMELFQKARLQALFGFVDDNDKRQYNECLIIEGRKMARHPKQVQLRLICYATMAKARRKFIILLPKESKQHWALMPATK